MVVISFSTGDYCGVTVLSIMENQILKAINHIMYTIQKKPCTLKILDYSQSNLASTFDYYSVEDKLNELKSNRIIDDSYKITNSIQEVMNFVTEDEVNMYSSEDESNDSHRTTTSPKIITPEITSPYVNISTTQEPQISAINVTKAQVQSLENKLFSKILGFNSYFMDKILSLRDEIKLTKLITMCRSSILKNPKA